MPVDMERMIETDDPVYSFPSRGRGVPEGALDVKASPAVPRKAGSAAPARADERHPPPPANSRTAPGAPPALPGEDD